MPTSKIMMEFVARNRGELPFLNREPEFEIKTPEIILKLREYFPDQNFSAAKNSTIKEDFPTHQKFEYGAKDFYDKNIEKFTVSSTNNQILDYKKQSNCFFDRETIKKDNFKNLPHSKPSHKRSLSTIGRNKKINSFFLKDNDDDCSFDEEKTDNYRRKSSLLQNPAFTLEKDKPITDDLRNICGPYYIMNSEIYSQFGTITENKMNLSNYDSRQRIIENLGVLKEFKSIFNIKKNDKQVYNQKSHGKVVSSGKKIFY